MSGPKSASYTLSAELVERLHVAQLQEEQERQRAEEERRRIEAERQRREAEARARAEEARRLERVRQQKLEAVRTTQRRLATTREDLYRAIAQLPPDPNNPVLPVLPEIWDESSAGLDEMMALLHEIDQRLAQIHHRLRTANALGVLDLSSLGQVDSLDAMLDRFLASTGLKHAPSTTVDNQSRNAADRREAVDRIVGRLRDTPLKDLPTALESLIQRAASSENIARFDMICTELRLRVQQHNERVDARRRSMAVAAEWRNRLATLDVQGRHADLREQLADVVAGVRPWDGDLEQLGHAALAELEEAAQRTRDALAAKILESTLKDLGYEVEGIAHTLFAEGGTVLFQGRGWNDYFMRMRVSPERGAMHFNMVRAADAPASTEQDQEIEQRWCHGYPDLLSTLAARGIKATAVRALAAGSFAVEPVQREALPKRQMLKKSQTTHDATKSINR
ncbi:hypothetical protein [Hydrogenophaga sp.]|uniref:hypothetical protein n=1 Tax=Hydrogenophaga sp. TaxID=1904254 RepID=UPI00286D7769|nr:hypothetical protein [Hydrogenophaga sp.]